VRAKSAPTAPVLREQAQQDGGSGSRKHHDEDRAFDRDSDDLGVRGAMPVDTEPVPKKILHALARN
jgi:hypothetical protein